ncbi:MAG: sigma-54 dependent transcriptional regulator [Proteobacteria bacterium]|nr:sigma-54 dependent transcriptional regulator [Pseudomonadota bacterium]
MSIEPNMDNRALELVCRGKVLLVEDEHLFAKAVARKLERVGYACTAVGTIAAAEIVLDEQTPNLVLLDMRLPDGSGLDFLERIDGTVTPVIVMTAYGEVQDAVSAMKLAAADYLKKPIDLDELLLAVDKVLANQKVSTQLANSRAREAYGTESIVLVGVSDQITYVREQIEKYATLCSPANSLSPTVLIMGETGTGKDVVARLLHQSSDRRGNPFVHVDCAALPPDLIEAELFGHVKGAFTNAQGDRTGLIEMAEDGVVFLDEISELPPVLQAKLLAVLERRRLRRVGSSREYPVGAWFMAATNREVEKLVAEGDLRRDLFYRLNMFSLNLPPLRERGGDIVELAEYFADQLARRHDAGAVSLSTAAKNSLTQYAWPGNVRELRYVIERAALLNDGTVIEAEDLMLPLRPRATGASEEIAGMTLDEAEKTLIKLALDRCRHNVSAAARELGITRMAMRYRMKRHGLHT